MSNAIARPAQRFRFGNVKPAAVDAVTTTSPDEKSSFSLKLLVVFLFLMYSSIGVIYPATEAFRPIMVVALGAVVCAVLEVTRSGRGFQLAWPEGVMVMALLGVAAISTFGSIYISLAADTTMNFAKIVL